MLTLALSLRRSHTVLIKSAAMVFVPTTNLFPRTSILEYGATGSVADNTLTTVLSFTVLGSPAFIDAIHAGGNLPACFSLIVNTILKLDFQNSHTERTKAITLPAPQRFAVGDVVDIKVEHFQVGKSGIFTATIFGHR